MKNQSIAWNPTIVELPVPAGTYAVGPHAIEFTLPTTYDNGSIPESTDLFAFCESDIVWNDADRDILRLFECRSLSGNRCEFLFDVQTSSWTPGTTTRFYFLVVKRGVFHFNVATYLPS